MPTTSQNANVIPSPTVYEYVHIKGVKKVSFDSEIYNTLPRGVKNVNGLDKDWAPQKYATIS